MLKQKSTHKVVQYVKMLRGLIITIKSGPSKKKQEAALKTAGLDVDGKKDKEPPVHYDDAAGAINVLFRGDVLVIAVPSVLAGRTPAMLKTLNAIEAKGAIIRTVVPPKDYGEKLKDWKAVFMADAIIDSQRHRGSHARKHRTPDKMGGRPFLFRKGTVRYEAGKKAWENPKLSQDEAAKIAGVAASTLYRHFGKKGTPMFGKPATKLKPKPRKRGKK